MHRHCFRLLLGHVHVPGEIANNEYAKFLGVKEVHYGIVRVVNEATHWERGHVMLVIAQLVEHRNDIRGGHRFESRSKPSFLFSGINLSTNQPISQSARQPVNQSINQSIHRV